MPIGQELLIIIILGVVIVIASGLAAYGVISSLLGGGGVDERLQSFAVTQETAPSLAVQRNRRSRITQLRWRINSLLGSYANWEKPVI